MAAPSLLRLSPHLTSLSGPLSPSLRFVFPFLFTMSPSNDSIHLKMFGGTQIYSGWDTGHGEEIPKLNKAPKTTWLIPTFGETETHMGQNGVRLPKQ